MSTAQIVQTVSRSAVTCGFVHAPVRLVTLDYGPYR